MAMSYKARVLHTKKICGKFPKEMSLTRLRIYAGFSFMICLPPFFKIDLPIQAARKVQSRGPGVSGFHIFFYWMLSHFSSFLFILSLLRSHTSDSASPKYFSKCHNRFERTGSGHMKSGFRDGCE